jgi:hypothetical protein
MTDDTSDAAGAANRFLDDVDTRSLTLQIDEVADLIASDESSQTALRVGQLTLGRDIAGP